VGFVGWWKEKGFTERAGIWGKLPERGGGKSDKLRLLGVRRGGPPGKEKDSTGVRNQARSGFGVYGAGRKKTGGGGEKKGKEE